MMAQIIYNLAVKESSYIDNQGQTKNRYLNVGSIIQKKDGGKFILLKRSFNPAGIANPDNKDNIAVSLFKPKGQQQAPAQPSGAVNQQAAAYHAAKNGTPPTLADIHNDNLDELPF